MATTDARDDESRLPVHVDAFPAGSDVPLVPVHEHNIVLKGLIRVRRQQKRDKIQREAMLAEIQKLSEEAKRLRMDPHIVEQFAELRGSVRTMSAGQNQRGDGDWHDNAERVAQSWMEQPWGKVILTTICICIVLAFASIALMAYNNSLGDFVRSFREPAPVAEVRVTTDDDSVSVEAVNPMRSADENEPYQP